LKIDTLTSKNMKNTLLILAVAILVGCAKSDTEYSAQNSSPSPSDRYGTNRATTSRDAMLSADTNALPNPDIAQANNPSAQTAPTREGIQSPTINRSDREQLEQRVESDLGQQVQAALSTDEKFSGIAKNIEVTSGAEGTVILRGSVSSETEKSDIATRVRSIDGVKNVDNQLTVKSSDNQK
jgi:hyperosmotically inducible protein